MKPVSISQAASMTGKSKSTILRAIKKGAISATKDGSGYRIDPAELARAFTVAPLDAHHDEPMTRHDAPSTAALETENRLLREMLERERETVDDLRQRLTRTQALIEDQRPRTRRPSWWPW